MVALSADTGLKTTRNSRLLKLEGLQLVTSNHSCSNAQWVAIRRLSTTYLETTCVNARKSRMLIAFFNAGVLANLKAGSEWWIT